MDKGWILVTGGSGFLGINMVRKLLEHGESKIRIIDIADFDYPERNKVDTIIGDVRDLDLVRKCMRGVKWVVHTAAALPLYSEEDIFSTEVEGMRNVLIAAEEEGVERVVDISSTAVYGIPDHHPIFEGDKLDGVGPYGKAKIQAEKIAVEFRAKGMCVPILRPKSFIGKERLGVFALLYDWAYTGHGFPMIGSGDNRYQLMDVEDFCDAIWLSLTASREKANDTFNIGAKEFTTMREDYQAVLDRAGHGRKIRPFPAKLAIFGLRILEKLGLSPLYMWVYETACEDSFVSIEKAEKTLGFSPRFSNKDALIRNYDWYVENLDQFKNKSGVSHRVPWKQGVLGLIKHFY
ncbi:MAG: NAD-dependent epimerase/dehydratase family protein [Kiritimatiellae bacterium]|nr:NAD-dependent epimerase/dehydratase family protein [Kiritimatiellia bacterium]